MYGLRQAGRLANKQLEKVLATGGYYLSKYTPGLYLHKTRPISFTLVVDDFGIKYVNKSDALHLEKTISNSYPMKSDWEGKRYIGIDLKWDYQQRTLITSMDGYIKNALLQFQHSLPKQHFYSPSRFTPPNYGAKQQFTKHDDSPPMTPEQTKRLEQVTGKFLYIARAIDDTMMHALNALATAKHNGTQETAKAVTYLLDYCSSNQNPSKLYRASDMILHCHSDAAYLVASRARSRAGGFLWLGNKDGELVNGSIAVLAKLIRCVMASASEAEVAALFMNARAAVPFRITLCELGHPQPPTPIRTDNSTADGIANGTIKQNKTKAIDMRFYWLRDRVEQNQFNVYWAPGKTNLADYFTKHHSPAHHRRVRPIYVNTPTSPKDLQGCIGMLSAPPARPKSPVQSKPHLTPLTHSTSSSIQATRTYGQTVRTHGQTAGHHHRSH